jgi:glucans biosynthesis protein
MNPSLNPSLHRNDLARSAGRLALVILGVAGAGFSIRAAGEVLDFEAVRARAQELARAPYEGKPRPLPDWLLKLNYDQYRDIRFVPTQSWWNRERLPFKLQFFHPGFVFTRTVQVNEIVDGTARLIPFERRFFDYGHNEVGPLPASIGYAGFRIHNFLNQPNDELGVFQGASYFRFLCRKAVYGLSARGLAVDTAEPTGEEFPNFEEFWVRRPAPEAKEIVVYALLNGPSVTGAYEFAIEAGNDTVMHVHAVVYCRRNPTIFGLAPLTSMFWHGKNSDEVTDDYRPEVHDSDGLMINAGSGEWLWRPLTNPASTRVMSFVDELNPRGFGLVQRERDFASYEDLEANYQLRPSAWVEPVGDWGRGCVRLVELHAPDETGDNIVAFWVPEKLPPAGEPIEVEYNLHWFMDQIKPPLGYVISTRNGRSRTFETDLERFVVDFDGPALRRQDPDSGIEAFVEAGSGTKVVHTSVQKNPYNGSWRAAFALRPDGSGQPVELRCQLRRASKVLTETWSYLWQP